MALSAIFTALCTSLIIVGGLLDIFDLTVCALCSFIIAAAICEIGGKYPTLIFFASAVLSFIFMPMSSAAFYYAGFFGYYPILRKIIIKRVKKPFSKILSILIFNGSMALILFLFTKLFISENDTALVYVSILIVGNIFFVCYDFLLDKFDIIYRYKIKKLFKPGK